MEPDEHHEVPELTLRQQLVQALGLPPETFLVEFVLSDTVPIYVRCQYYPTREAMQHAWTLLAEYRLVAKDQEPVAMPDPLVTQES